MLLHRSGTEGARWFGSGTYAARSGPARVAWTYAVGCGFGRDAVWTASLVAQYVVDAYDPHNFNQLKARCTIAGFCNPVVDRIFL